MTNGQKAVFNQLGTIDQHAPVTAKEIAQETGLTFAFVSSALKKLCAAKENRIAWKSRAKVAGKSGVQPAEYWIKGKGE